MDQIRKMLHEFLLALGFGAMARDVLAETEWSRLQLYARIVLKQSPAAQKASHSIALRAPAAGVT